MKVSEETLKKAFNAVYEDCGIERDLAENAFKHNDKMFMNAAVLFAMSDEAGEWENIPAEVKKSGQGLMSFIKLAYYRAGRNNDELADSVKQISRSAADTIDNTKFLLDKVSEAYAVSRKDMEIVLSSKDEVIKAKEKEIGYLRTELEKRDKASVNDSSRTSAEKKASSASEMQQIESFSSKNGSLPRRSSLFFKRKEAVKEGGSKGTMSKQEREEFDRRYSVFIDTYMSNPAYSDEQKAFLMECFQKNIPLSQIKKFARENISVEIMKELQKYYENSVL